MSTANGDPGALHLEQCVPGDLAEEYAQYVSATWGHKVYGDDYVNALMLSECDDDCIDGRATPSSSSQLRGAASDGLINRFHIAHPEKPLLKEVPAGIATERLREDDRRDDWGPQAGAS